MGNDGILLFDLDPDWGHGARIARHLEVPVSLHEERGFEDGELKVRPLVGVRNRDVYVVQSLHGDAERSVHDKLCRLLFFVGAVKDASAASVTVVAPYLAYARKDRRTKPRDPVTLRYLAGMMEAVGVDRVVAVDVHNDAAFENAFRCRTEHLEARKLFAAHLAPLVGQGGVSVVSPDVGGVKRAERLRESLEHALGRDVGLAFMEKTRSGGVVRGGTLVGDVQGRTVAILDDLISTGTTMMRAASACRAAGGGPVFALATHGLFVGGAPTVVASPLFDHVVVTDTLPPFRLPEKLVSRRVTVLPTAPLLAEAIARIHGGGSVSDLLAD
ncbi:ribose-phosphate diphosphokinase [Azospirillum formosense]|uniref:ribose-phosphate diphosphokinase n=1 Tax=Azospirillum formosense TaxID=861533 RepID=A0ABX2KTS2_9PROT|nr:ribose-phosphate pyrophosphokinase [Azospirillum formosense]MBY3755875.1 ribose-phosphate pyrophosphokinase [Azospirillum formosense]NUB19038.1 ribose-phosphate diphosphokinase [Azospirillum formosense]